MNVPTQTVDLTAIADIDPGSAITWEGATAVASFVVVVIGLCLWAARPERGASIDKFGTALTAAAIVGTIAVVSIYPVALTKAEARTNFTPYAATIEQNLATEHNWTPKPFNGDQIVFRNDPFTRGIVKVVRALDTDGATFRFDGSRDGEPTVMYLTTNGTTRPEVTFAP